MQPDKCTTGTVVDSDKGDMVSEKSLTNLMHNIKYAWLFYMFTTLTSVCGC